MLIALAALILAPNPPMICIDPGHPSEVGRGTRGKHLTEIQAAWQVGLSLKAKLLEQGYRVVLTKSRAEQNVKNRRRAEIANGSNAALMVRLHCDAARGSGFTVFIPTKPGKSQGVTGPSNEVIQRSGTLGARFHAAFAASLKGQLTDGGLKSDTKTAVGGKQGALTGSIFSKVPVVLVEMVVLTNPKDEAFIASTSGRLRMAQALTRGVQAAVPLSASN